MDDEEILAVWAKHCAVMAAMNLGLLSFATKIIVDARSGSSLDDATLIRIQDESILDMKNFDLSGPSVEVEVEIFQEAIDGFKKMIGRAIGGGIEGQELLTWRPGQIKGRHPEL
jgi:hypothetical protein